MSLVTRFTRRFRVSFLIRNKIQQRVSRRRFSSSDESLVTVSPWSKKYPQITRVVMNAPKKRNSLSSSMMLQLTESLNKAVEMDDTRVIVLSGNGPVFSAGHDIKEIQTLTEGMQSHHDKHGCNHFFGIATDLMLAIHKSPRPIIAATHGWAAAAGCQLALACDLIVSMSDCKFATSGINVGIFCSTPGVELSRSVHTKIAMQMLLTGQPITAQRAYEVGMVNAVCESENEFDNAIEELALSIASKSMSVTETGKHTFYDQLCFPLEEAYDIAAASMVHNIGLKDAKEGVEAFLNKRKPTWTDK